jgi:hypothetical protein
MQGAFAYIVATRQLCAAGRLNPNANIDADTATARRPGAASTPPPPRSFKCDSHDAAAAEQAATGLVGKTALQAVADRLAASIDAHFSRPEAASYWATESTSTSCLTKVASSALNIQSGGPHHSTKVVTGKLAAPLSVNSSPWARARKVVAGLRATSALASLASEGSKRCTLNP